MKISSIAEKPIFRTKITSSNVKITEMAIGYFLAPFCAMLANSIFGAYLNRYYVDVLGWTKFGAFATLLPIVSVIFVVLGNLVIGQWIDNTRTSQGKARPYMLLSAPLVVVAVILMFLTPTEGSNIVQMMWIAVTYNLYYAVAYPCFYTAHSSMVALSTRNSGQRGILATLSNASMVASAGIGASIVVPILLQSYLFVSGDAGLDVAASYAHWRIASIAFALLCFFGIMLEYYFTRERITEENVQLNIKEEKLPLGKQIQACIHEKYWWIIILYFLLFQFAQLVKNSSMSFYARWMFDSVISSASPEQTSGALMSTLGLIGGIPTAVGMVLAWPIANKLGKKIAVVGGLVFSVLGGLVCFINVHSFAIVCVGVVLKGIGTIPACYVTMALLSDVLDHLEARNGFRSDGFTMSVYGSIMVGLTGICTGVINGLLTFAGYSNTGIACDPSTMTAIEDAASYTGTVVYRQLGGVENVLAFAYLAIDVICYVVIVVLMSRLNVEKHIEEDQKTIILHQKEAVLAAGGTWVEPEERMRREQEAADRKAEEDRKKELQAYCQKKGLDFESEEAKYQQKQAQKRARAEARAKKK
jgi:GPH family glycoside/pentoside/hexuronide:cation symporter